MSGDEQAVEAVPPLERGSLQSLFNEYRWLYRESIDKGGDAVYTLAATLETLVTLGVWLRVPDEEFARIPSMSASIAAVKQEAEAEVRQEYARPHGVGDRGFLAAKVEERETLKATVHRQRFALPSILKVLRDESRGFPQPTGSQKRTHAPPAETGYSAHLSREVGGGT